jgi:2-haloacid dehalogenase
VSATLPAARVVVFDLGGVLFDWTPEDVYRELIPDDAARAHFLAHVCNHDWRVKQDGGQSLADGTEELVAQHPEHEALIRAFYVRWPEMLRGKLPRGMAIFNGLRAAGVPLYALTNWASETWPIALARYPFLQGFRRIVVSGDERLVKPDPAIFRLTHDRLLLDLPGIAEAEVAFIDDNLPNVEAAARFGWRAIHHADDHAERTTAKLREFGVPLPT